MYFIFSFDVMSFILPSWILIANHIRVFQETRDRLNEKIPEGEKKLYESFISIDEFETLLSESEGKDDTREPTRVTALTSTLNESSVRMEEE